jgi:hypothetical protein
MALKSISAQPWMQNADSFIEGVLKARPLAGIASGDEG